VSASEQEASTAATPIAIAFRLLGIFQSGSRIFMVRIALLPAQLSDRDLGDFVRIVNACCVDFDNLARDEVTERIVAINQIQRLECASERLIESLGFARSNHSAVAHRHGPLTPVRHVA
jgi:hypothetical protein